MKREIVLNSCLSMVEQQDLLLNEKRKHWDEVLKILKDGLVFYYLKLGHYSIF